MDSLFTPSKTTILYSKKIEKIIHLGILRTKGTISIDEHIRQIALLSKKYDPLIYVAKLYDKHMLEIILCMQHNDSFNFINGINENVCNLAEYILSFQHKL